MNNLKKYISIVLSFLLILSVVNIPFSYAEETVDYTWKSVSLGGGGYITGLSVADDGTVYARCDVGGIYKWNENEKYWDSLTEWITRNEQNLFGIDGIAVQHNNSDVVYAAMGKYTAQTPHGLYKTTDGGKSWTRTSFNGIFGGNSEERFRGEPIAINPFNSNEIIVSSRDGALQKSADGGESWTKIESFPAKSLGKYSKCVIYDSLAEGVVYAEIKNEGVYKSVNGGENWTKLSGENAPLIVNRMRISNGILFVAANNGILKYDGDGWSVINNFELNGETSFRALDVDKNNPDRIICCFDDGRVKTEFDNVMFYTEDGGINWTDISSNAIKNKTVNWWPDYYFSAHTSDMYFMGDKGVWLSDWYGVWKTENIKAESTEWINEIRGIENMVAFDLTCPTEGAPLIVGVADNCGMRVENTDVYPEEKLLNPLKNITSGIDFCESNPNIVARVATNSDGDGAIGISTDNGITYSQSRPYSFSGGKIAVSASTDENGNASIVFVPANDLPYYSKDMGATWTKGTFPVGTDVRFIDQIWRWNMVLQSDRVRKDVFYLINPQNGNFYVSEDGGENWELRYQRGTGKAAVSIKTAPYKENTIYMSLANEGLKKSTDGGRTFTSVENVQYSHLVAFGKGRDNLTPALYLYGRVNNEEGIFRSVNMGESWVKISNTQTAVGNDPNCMEGDRHTFGTVYIGTNGKGFYMGSDRIETELFTVYEEDRTNSTLALQPWNARPQGGEIGSCEYTDEMSFNGNKSYKVWASQGGLQYNMWNPVGDLNEDVFRAIEADTAYICGWFYSDGIGKTIKLVQKNVTLPQGEWVFLSEKINSKDLKNGVWDTRDEGNIYMDDIKIISVSDKSKPSTPERVIEVPDKPNAYTKHLYTFYSNGVQYASAAHNTGSAIISSESTEHITEGHSKSLKMTGDLYLQAKLNDEIIAAVKEGRAYLTYWQYSGSAKIDENAGVDRSWVGRIAVEDEWVWCSGLLSEDAFLTRDGGRIYFKCRNKYLWLDDLSITVFEDREKTLFEDEYSIRNSNGEDVLDFVNSGDRVTYNSKVFNNTNKSESVFPIAVIYLSSGALENVLIGEEFLALPYKYTETEIIFSVPENSLGKTVKLMLWSDFELLKPLRETVILNVK
jgi:xyloglucan-specific exo-beta-1,4-glucanase